MPASLGREMLELCVAASFAVWNRAISGRASKRLRTSDSRICSPVDFLEYVASVA